MLLEEIAWPIERVHAFRIGCGLVAIGALDWVVCAFVLPKWLHDRQREQALWFFLHASVNAAIAALCIPALSFALSRPTEVFYATAIDPVAATPWPLTLAVCIHVYHCIGRFSLSWSDRLHHVLFIPTLGLPGMVFDWGCLGNVLVFFACGAPGAIDYYILAMQRSGRLLAFNQKRICANLNLWFRMPGIMFCMGICYCACYHHIPHVPGWALALQVTFMPFSVLYYTKQSLINYALHTAMRKKFLPQNLTWSDLRRLQDAPLG